MLGKPRLRAPRPKVIHFSEEALLEQWKPLAELRSLQFSGDGSMYTKACRNQGVDREGLILHAPAWKPLLQLAPSGFPSKTTLTNVFAVVGAAATLVAIVQRLRRAYVLIGKTKPVGRTEPPASWS